MYTFVAVNPSVSEMSNIRMKSIQDYGCIHFWVVARGTVLGGIRDIINCLMMTDV